MKIILVTGTCILSYVIEDYDGFHFSCYFSNFGSTIPWFIQNLDYGWRLKVSNYVLSTYIPDYSSSFLALVVSSLFHLIITILNNECASLENRCY